MKMALLVLCAVLGQTPLDRAERAYRSGDYEAAKQGYEQWLENHSHGRVEYNAGNCEFRLGNWARALWRYERALRALGDREEVRFNRALAVRKLGRVEGEGKGIAANVRDSLRRWETSDWTLLALPLELLGLALLAWTLKRRTLLLGVLAATCLVAGGLAWVRALSLDEDRVLGAIILEDGVELRAEPRQDLPAVARLGAGVRAEFREGSAQWVKLRVRERVGWVDRDSVGLY